MNVTNQLLANMLVRNWLLGILVVIALLTILTLADVVFIPVFMAFFLSAVLSFPVMVLQRLRIPQALAAGIVLISFCAGVIALFSIVYAPAAEWSSRLPELSLEIQERLSPIRQTLEDVQDTAEQIEQATEIAPQEQQPALASPQEPPLIARLFAQARILLGQIVVTVILTFFLLSSNKSFISNRGLAVFGGTGRRIRISLVEAGRQMSHYISLVSLINLGVGVLAGLIVYFTGLPNPILWGVAVTLLNFVPYVGPVVSLVGVAVISLLTFTSWTDILVPVLGFGAIHFLEGEIVTPLVLGRTMALHPVTIILSVLVWGWMWGLAGAFLAVPILLTVTIAFRKVLMLETVELED